MIRPVTSHDIPAITAIYNYYIEHSTVTFEEACIDENEMQNRIQKITEKFPWLVFEHDYTVQAFAFAAPWKQRSAYQFSVETSIYVDHKSQKKGIGTNLYTYLIKELSKLKLHALIGGITLPNEASIRLHEKMGFNKIGEFEEVGFKFDEWRNVGYWQLLVNT